MTWVKLCGLTRREDVEGAVEAGADAVGFVIAAGSPRRVTPEAAAALGRGIPATRFVVTVDLTPDELLAAVRLAGADGVQPYGRWAGEAAAAACRAGYRVLFPVAVGGGVDLEGVPPGAMPLLDCVSEDGQGGTGRSFDWRLAAAVTRPVVMAGGLTPDNVGRAVALAGPWGVDVATGIEVAPGVKDRELMRRFVEAARW